MEQSLNDVASWGCTSNAQKVGLCYRHGSKSINANNNNNNNNNNSNPTVELNAVVSAIPPHQPVNYED